MQLLRGSQRLKLLGGGERMQLPMGGKRLQLLRVTELMRVSEGLQLLLLVSEGLQLRRLGGGVRGRESAQRRR